MILVFVSDGEIDLNTCYAVIDNNSFYLSFSSNLWQNRLQFAFFRSSFVQNRVPSYNNIETAVLDGPSCIYYFM